MRDQTKNENVCVCVCMCCPLNLLLCACIILRDPCKLSSWAIMGQAGNLLAAWRLIENNAYSSQTYTHTHQVAPCGSAATRAYGRLVKATAFTFKVFSLLSLPSFSKFQSFLSTSFFASSFPPVLVFHTHLIQFSFFVLFYLSQLNHLHPSTYY